MRSWSGLRWAARGLVAGLAACLAFLAIGLASGTSAAGATTSFPATISGSATFSQRLSGTETYQDGEVDSDNTSIRVTVSDGVWDRVGSPSSPPISYSLKSGKVTVTGSADVTARDVNGVPSCEFKDTLKISPRAPAPGEYQQLEFDDVSGGGQSGFAVTAPDIETRTRTYSPSCHGANTTSTMSRSYVYGNPGPFKYTISPGPSFSGTGTYHPTCPPESCDQTETDTVSGPSGNKPDCEAEELAVANAHAYAKATGDFLDIANRELKALEGKPTPSPPGLLDQTNIGALIAYKAAVDAYDDDLSHARSNQAVTAAHNRSAQAGLEAAQTAYQKCLGTAAAAFSAASAPGPRTAALTSQSSACTEQALAVAQNQGTVDGDKVGLATIGTLQVSSTIAEVRKAIDKLEGLKAKAKSGRVRSAIGKLIRALERGDGDLSTVSAAITMAKATAAADKRALSIAEQKLTACQHLR